MSPERPPYGGTVIRRRVRFLVDDGHEPAVVRVVGELDAAASPAFTRTVEERLRAGRSVEVDLSGTVFLDSTGLRALLVALRAAEEAGVSFVVGSTSEFVERLFELTGLAELFAATAPPGDGDGSRGS